MNPDKTTPREPSLIDIEILDLGPLYEQAVEHYISLEPSRREWSAEKKGRLVIRTECRWGRVQIDPEKFFILNEKGGGPREPLSAEVKAYVSLYAEMPPVPGDPGFFESQPFCCVPIDSEAAATFKALGIVALEDFIRARIPELEAAYSEWLRILRTAKARSLATAEKLKGGQREKARV
jgi:hypothetical protein